MVRTSSTARLEIYGNQRARAGDWPVQRCFWTALLLLGCTDEPLVDNPPLDTRESSAIPAPVLEGLLVKGVDVPLTPPFAPNTRRYSVRAAEPAGALRVMATAAPELDIEIADSRTRSGALVDVDVFPGSRLDIEVENRLGAKLTYTIEYLPHDFPDLEVTVHEPGSSSDPIYVALRSIELYYLAKLDENGVPLFYRKAERSIADFKKHVGGAMSYAQSVAGGGSQHIVLSEDFQEFERVSTVDLVNTDEHEFHILPDGNYIVLAYERAVRDLTEFGMSAEEPVRDAILQELSPERDILFEWNSWDYMSYGESVYHKSKQDYAHINSVFVDTDGNWILSSRGTSQVLKIDRNSGEVIWRLGGMSSEFEFINDPFGGLCGQHTATRVENGNLLLFDNGQSCWPEMPERGELTRVVEYALDEQAKTAELVWSFERKGAYTFSQGSSQRLANGNTFIGWGIGPPMLASEVDPDGNIVFEIEARSPAGPVVSYRAYRFPD